MNIANFLKTTIFIEHLWWLLLYLLNVFDSKKKKEEEEEGFQILQKQSRLNDVNDTNFRNTTLQYDNI